MLNRSKNAFDKQKSCNFTVTNDHSWMFHQFPVRYTSPRMQRARRARQQRKVDNGMDHFPMPTIPVKFNANTSNRYEVQRKGGAQSDKPEAKPLFASCFIEKCELKERFKDVEVQRKICKHCQFENLVYKKDSYHGITDANNRSTDKINRISDANRRTTDVNHRIVDTNHRIADMNHRIIDYNQITDTNQRAAETNHKYPVVNPILNMNQRYKLNSSRTSHDTTSYKFPDSDWQTSMIGRHPIIQNEDKTEIEAEPFSPLPQTSVKQRIVVQMPDIYSEVTSEYGNTDNITRGSTLSYTHRKK